MTLIALTGAGLSTAATSPAAVVHAAPYPPQGPHASIDTSVACAGCMVTTTWSGYKPGSTIAFTLLSTPMSLGTETADADGTAVFNIVIPDNVPPGQHTITGTGIDSNGDRLAQSLQIMVTESKSASDVPGLAHTGANVLLPAGLAAASVGVGGVVILTMRRRSASASADR